MYMRFFRCFPVVICAMTAVLCVSVAHADLDAGLFQVRIAARSSYLSNVPVLVRIEVLDRAGHAERGLWDAVATLTVDHPSITCSPAEVHR